jgi:uncharacterized membrane protein
MKPGRPSYDEYRALTAEEREVVRLNETIDFATGRLQPIVPAQPRRAPTTEQTPPARAERGAYLIAVILPSEEKAEEVRQEVLGMHKDHLIDIGDAVIATRTEHGRVKLNQLMSTAAAGAAGGSFWGLLVGVLFLNPLLGKSAGAGSGALAGALTDVGINDSFMKAAADLKPGEAMLLVLVRKITGDTVLAQLQGVGGHILQTSLDHTREEALRKALAG